MEPLATFVPLPGHVLKVSGEIDLSNADAFAEALELSGGNGGVTIDASDLQYLDSAGLRVLAAKARQLQEQGGKLIIESPTDPVYRVLEISGLDRIPSVEVRR